MIHFADTPQAQGLTRQIRAAWQSRSMWKCRNLQAVYRKAQDYYEQHNGVPPGQQHDDLQSTKKEIAMSLEQQITELTAAVKELTAKISGASVNASAGKADAAADKPATTGKTTGAGKGAGKTSKPTVTREQVVAVLQEVKEKFDLETAREMFAPTKKMAEIPEGDFEKVYKAAKAKLEEEEGNDEGGDGDDM